MKFAIFEEMLTMRKLIVLLFVATLGVCASAQMPAAADSLQAQAKRMANGLVSGDYNTFIHYLHPKILQMAGGADAMKQQLAQMSRQFSMSNVSFESVTLDSMSKFIKVAPTLQATIRQHTIMKVPNGRMAATSTLICLSSDNGTHWKFVDTNHKTLADMRQMLPNLSTALVIPPTQAPVQLSQ